LHTNPTDTIADAGHIPGGLTLWPNVRVLLGGRCSAGTQGHGNTSAQVKGQIGLFHANVVVATSDIDEGVPMQMGITYVDDDVPFVSVLCKRTWPALAMGVDAEEEPGTVLLMALSEHSCKFRDPPISCADASSNTAQSFLGEMQVSKRFTDVQTLLVGDFMNTGRDQVFFILQESGRDRRREGDSGHVLWALTDLCWKWEGKIKFKNKKKKSAAKTKRKGKDTGGVAPVGAGGGGTDDSREVQLKRVVRSLRVRAASGVAELSRASVRSKDKTDTILHLQALISQISLNAPSDVSPATVALCTPRHSFLRPREVLKPYGSPKLTAPELVGGSHLRVEEAVCGLRARPFSRLKVLDVRHSYCCVSASLKVNVTFESMDSPQATALRWVSISCSKDFCTLHGKSTQLDIVMPGQQCTLQACIAMPLPGGIGALHEIQNTMPAVDVSLHYQITPCCSNSTRATGGHSTRSNALGPMSEPSEGHADVSTSPFECPYEAAPQGRLSSAVHSQWVVEVLGQINLQTDDFLRIARNDFRGTPVEFFPESISLVLHSTKTDLRQLARVFAHAVSPHDEAAAAPKEVVQLGEGAQMVLNESAETHHRTCSAHGRDLKHVSCFLETLRRALPGDVTATINPVSPLNLRPLQKCFAALKDEVRTAVEWRSTPCGKELEQCSSGEPAGATSLDGAAGLYTTPMARYCDMVLMKQMETDRLVAALAINASAPINLNDDDNQEAGFPSGHQ
jgi:hypothetical protein